MFRTSMFAAAMLSVALVASAQVAPTPPARDGGQPAREGPSPSGTATIRGRAIDAASGHGLSRVEMRAGPNAGQANGRVVLTDGDGRYEIKGLPAGTYTIIASKPNYVRTSWGEARVEGPGKRIPLADGQLLENIDVKLLRSGAVRGRIVDEFGEVVTDVSVSAMQYRYQAGSRMLTAVGRTGSTNDIGEYKIYGLSPGEYYISATLRNGAIGPANDSADRSGYAATYFPGTGNIAGAQRLTIAAGQTLTGIDLSLLPVRTARVSGVAFDDRGRPLVKVTIVGMQRIGFSMRSSSVAVTGADGSFVVAGLTPGEYQLRAINGAGPGAPEATAVVNIDGSDITDLQLTVTKPSTLSGRVTFADGGGAPPKASTIHVTAMRTEPMMFGPPGNATVKDDLTFEMSVAAGHVFVRSPTGPNWRLGRVLLGDADVTDTGIDVPVNAAIPNIVIELTDHIYPISGRVTDADGNVVRDCDVIVFGKDPGGWTPGTRFVARMRPGGDDLYHGRMPAGDYYAVAMTDVPPNAWTDSEFLGRIRESATTFSLIAGTPAVINLPVSPAPVF
ncbi:MAG TPA: carboxypeptidase-like regulatory domain-containing protein [Vicinamibacterales bacterium]